jgi:hypothetical protein
MPTTKLKNAQLPDVIQSKTIDTSNDIDTTTTKLTITGGTNGQVLSTDGSGNLSWTTAGGGGGLGAPTFEIVKSANETVTSSTTLQDDDHLFQALTNGKTYYFEMNAIATRENTTNLLTFKVSFAGNSDGHFAALQTGATNILCDGTSSLQVFNLPASTAGVPTQFTFKGVVKLTTDFTLKLRWAQQTSNTTGATIMKGSRLTIWEVA